MDNNTYGKYIEAKVDLYLKHEETFPCGEKVAISI